MRKSDDPKCKKFSTKRGEPRYAIPNNRRADPRCASPLRSRLLPSVTRSSVGKDKSGHVKPDTKSERPRCTKNCGDDEKFE